MTRGLFLDRRALMNSYDPDSDPAGQILTQILGAAVPVSAGINLDYYFSRVDPAKYGSGTKLSHNVCGLLGVCNGIDDDLRTGIPVQMTELHEPLRLLVIVEQTPEIIIQVLERNRDLAQLVDNGWVRLSSVHPVTREASFYSPRCGFVIVENLETDILHFQSSKECYARSRENISPACINAV